MKIRLLMLFALISAATLCLSAQQSGFKGTVVDAETGRPVAGASVIVEGQNILVTTGPNGDFRISNAQPGQCNIVVVAYGYNDLVTEATAFSNAVDDIGALKLKADVFAVSDNSESDVLLSESMLEDEEGNSQAVGALTGASDNVYYQTSNYEFNVMRFRFRGYDQKYSTTYINGVGFNEPIRGRFNYSMLGGMNNAFRSRSTSVGIAPSMYGFGGIGGTTNISTFVEDYAPGLRASVAYTNSNYYVRGMATYTTGFNKNGWAATISAIGRYSDEGIYPGTFYHSGGYFLSVEKKFGDKHSLHLTSFGAPTQRASNSAIYEETAILADDYRYNPNWGWQDGKKRSARVVESFDPTAIINWLWRPNSGTQLNTGFGFRASNYSSSALNWYRAADPRPDYYRYLPSFYDEGSATRDLYTTLWQTDESMRQIDWQSIYNANHFNNMENAAGGVQRGSTYILEKRHSNQLNYQLNSTLLHRINDHITLNAGIGANHTKGTYYKTVKDLLGGEYWLDIDQFSERDFPNQPDMLQNDLNNPDRKVVKGDKFGYHYDINVYTANAWLQNLITLPHWDINYGINVSYTSFQREGRMRNGRAPENSYGVGKRHEFDNAGFKFGATYKIDGRNNFVVNALYQTNAPLADQAYISPRIKDDVITDLQSERVLSGDISYVFNYRRFKGVVTGFYTDTRNGIERFSFFDDQRSTFMNYAMTNVHRVYKGVEFGVAFKATPSVTVTAAGTYARYQYKDRPTGTRSYENGTEPDETQTVYLNNYYVGSTPQQAYNIGIDWAAPGMWFFNINGSWMGDSYVDISPVRHEAMPDLWTICSDEAEVKRLTEEITAQEKLRDAFVLNASIGKLIYLNRTASLNINVNVENMLNNRKIMTGGYQQGRFDYSNYNIAKFPNKYYYAQGIRVFVNVGVKF